MCVESVFVDILSKHIMLNLYAWCEETDTHLFYVVCSICVLSEVVDFYGVLFETK